MSHHCLSQKEQTGKVWSGNHRFRFCLLNFGVCKGYKERNQFQRKYWKPFGIFVYRWNWLIHLELSTSGLLRWCFKKISRGAALTLDGMKNHNTTDSTQLHEIRKKKHTAVKYKKVVKQTQDSACVNFHTAIPIIFLLLRAGLAADACIRDPLSKIDFGSYAE